MTPRPPQPQPRIDRAREATHSRSPEMPSPPCKVGLAKLMTGLDFEHLGTVALMHPYGDENKHRTNLLSERTGTCFQNGNWPLKDWLKD